MNKVKHMSTTKNLQDDQSKLKALEAAISQIEKEYGKGSIMRLGEHKKIDVEVISTGSISLDKALGVNGLPFGRMVEIYGAESSGKTTVTMHVIAEAQKKGHVCAFIDAEHAFDPYYAKKIGIKVEELLISQPDTGEQALEIVDTLARSGVVSLIVIDSVAALVPKAELEGDMGDSHMGLQARLMSQALRKLTPIVSRSNTMVIFINQIRHKIGVVFGNPETTTGGNALKFYASIRLEIKRVSQIKNGDESIGSETRVKVVKNKVAPPFKTASFDIMYGEGISKVSEILEYGVLANLIEKSGSWYSYEGKKIAQGKEAAKQFLKLNPDIANTIQKAIMSISSINEPIIEDVDKDIDGSNKVNDASENSNSATSNFEEIENLE